MKKEARNRSWGWMDIEKKIKGLDKSSDSQFSMCMSTLWFYRCYHLIHPLSAAASCERVTLFLLALCVSVCFSLLSCLFPPAWVNVRASCCSSQTTPWETDQPHRRGNPLYWLKERGKGGEERNFYASEPPLVSSSPLVLVHCSPGLNHVAKLPCFTVTREEEERRPAIIEKVTRNF